MKRTLLVAAVFLLLTGAVTADKVVHENNSYDDFETGSVLDGWTTNSMQSGDSFSIQQSTVYEGSYAAEYDYDGDQSGNIAMEKNLTQDFPTGTWVRMGFFRTTDASYDNFNVFQIRQEGADVPGFDGVIRSGDFELKGSANNWDSCEVNINSDTWYEVELRLNTDNTQDLRLTPDGGSSNSVTGCNAANDASFKYVYWGQEQGGSGSGGKVWWDFAYYDPYTNTAPTISDETYRPNAPDKGDSVDVLANVTDPDGDSFNVTATVRENGTKIVDGAELTDPDGDDEYNLTDAFTVDTMNVWYNTTVTADDGQDTSTANISYFAEDNAPNVTIKDPGNETFFEYVVGYTVDVDTDNDAVSGENATCDIFSNGNKKDTHTGQGTFTIDDELEQDLGSGIEFKASCTDDAGNTRNKTEHFSVQAYNITGTRGNAVTYETEDPVFDADFKAGDMINEITVFLRWNGSIEDTQLHESSGITTHSSLLEQTDVPLTVQNATNVTWNVTLEFNRTLVDGGTVLENDTTQGKEQEVRWSYWLNKSYLDPAEYVERQDLDHRTVVHTRTKEAALDPVTTYWRNGAQDTDLFVTANETEYIEWKGSIDTGNVTSRNESYNVSTSVDVSFQGKTRSITTPNETITVHRINLTDCNAGMDTAKALEFNTKYEKSGDPAETDLVMQADLWATGEIVRNVHFSSDAATTHDFCIYPSWASYTIDTEEHLIQYEQTHDDSTLRSYFLLQQRISNSTTSIPLYTINKSETSRISYKIEDDTGSAYPGVVCRIDRKFPGRGTYETVAQIKSGSDGRSETFLEVNEIYYKHICFKNGEQLDFFEDQIIVDPMTLQIGQEDAEDYFTYYNAFDGGLTCTANTTRITCDYHTDENVKKIALVVENKTKLTREEHCRVESTSASGSVTCTGLNTTAQRHHWKFIAWFPDNNKVLVDQGDLGDNPNPWGTALGMLITVAFIISGFGAGRFHPVAAIMLGTLGAVTAWIMNAFPIPGHGLLILVSIAGVVSWILSK